MARRRLSEMADATPATSRRSAGLRAAPISTRRTPGAGGGTGGVSDGAMRYTVGPGAFGSGAGRGPLGPGTPVTPGTLGIAADIFAISRNLSISFGSKP